MMKQMCMIALGAALVTLFTCETGANNDASVQSAGGPVLSRIEIAALPDTTYYALREEFSLEGLKINGVFSDETERLLGASEYTIKPEHPSTETSGAKWIAVKPRAQNVADEGFSIYVDKSTRRLKSIALTKPPSTTVYAIGQDFKTAGMTVTGTFTDNGAETSEDVTSNPALKITGYDKYTRGPQNITLAINKAQAALTGVTVKIPASMTVKVNDNVEFQRGMNYQKDMYKKVFVKGEPLDAERANLRAKVTVNGLDVIQKPGKGIYAGDAISGYNPDAPGYQTLSLKLDDAPAATFEVYVADVAPEVWFDYGYMRHAGDTTGKGPGGGNYYAKPNEELVLSPVRFLLGYQYDGIDKDGYAVHKDTGASYYAWSVTSGNSSNYTANSKGEYYYFIPTAAGTYGIQVEVTGRDYATGATVTRTATTTVVCGQATGAAGTFTQPLKNFSPGQFTRIGGTGYGWSLGHWGGYEVWRVNAQESYTINGNAFGGWNEPGVVWVMEDNNNNGLPDEPWYELKGSDDESAKYKDQVTRRYAVRWIKTGRYVESTNSYGQLVSANDGVFWVDGKGRARDAGGYGWPFDWGVPGDWVVYSGTLLRDDGIFWGYGTDTADTYAWGYVDAQFTDASRAQKFWPTRDARRADGSPISLSSVKFIKVHTGVFMTGNGFGEVSTELHSGDGFAGPPTYGFALQSDFPLP